MENSKHHTRCGHMEQKDKDVVTMEQGKACFLRRKRRSQGKIRETSLPSVTRRVWMSAWVQKQWELKCLNPLKEDAGKFHNALSQMHTEKVVPIMKKKGTTRMTSQSSPIQIRRSLLPSRQNLSTLQKRAGIINTTLTRP
jgi:hypothetical protein